MIHQAMKDAFPILPGKKVRAHLSHDTWLLIKFRRDINQIHRNARNAIQKKFLITILRAWQSWTSAGPDGLISDPDRHLRGLRMQTIAIGRLHDMTLPLATSRLRHDKAAYVTNIGTQIEQAPQQQKHALAWSLIKPLQVTRKSKASFGCQQLAAPPCDAHGTPITDPQALAQAKLDFFSQNEAADKCSPEQLASRYTNDCNLSRSLSRDGGDNGLSIHNVPPATAIVGSFAHAKRNRGAGTDSILDDLHFLAPHELTRVWHPLYTKMAFQVSEPLMFRGALLVNFFKGKGTPGPFENDRVIYLGATPSKHYHKWMRARAVHHVGNAIHDDQCAVKRHRSCIFTNHTVKCVQAYAHKNNLSVAIQFADIKSAFYKVVRQVVLKRVPLMKILPSLWPDFNCRQIPCMLCIAL